MVGGACPRKNNQMAPGSGKASSALTDLLFPVRNSLQSEKPFVFLCDERPQILTAIGDRNGRDVNLAKPPNTPESISLLCDQLPWP